MTDAFEENDYICYDIAPLIKKGRNFYTVQIDWYEDKMVKYVLFGENVSESLRNCMVYDTELDISDIAKSGENEIEVRFLLNNKNLMGPHHLVGAKDRYTAPNGFQLFGQWKEKESEQYHSYYDIKKFYA